MKKLIVSLFSASFMIASNIPMPPAIPSIDMTHSKKAKKVSPCAEVPPMLVMLPPPLAEAVNKCKNEQNMPKKDKISKVLSKYEAKKVKILNVTTVKDMVMIYKIKYEIDKKVKTIYCNDKLNRCFKGFVINN